MRAPAERYFALRVENADDVLGLFPYPMVSFVALVTERAVIEGDVGDLLGAARVRVDGVELRLSEPRYFAGKWLSSGYDARLDLKRLARHASRGPELYLCYPGVHFTDYYDPDPGSPYLLLKFERDSGQPPKRCGRVMALDINSNFVVVLELRRAWRAYGVGVPDVAAKWSYLENLLYNYEDALIVTERLAGGVAKYCYLLYHDLLFLLGSRVALVNSHDNSLTHYACGSRMIRVGYDVALCARCGRMVDVHVNACCNMVKKARELLGAGARSSGSAGSRASSTWHPESRWLAQLARPLCTRASSRPQLRLAPATRPSPRARPGRSSPSP